MPAVGHTLLTGVIHGISGFASLLVFLGFTAFATFFLVKDAPALGRWIEGHMGLPPSQARIVMSDIIQALRRYFLGLTIIAGISTAGVVIGSLIVGLPLLGTIAIITFLTSYVPIIGAWTAGIFVFALALATKGTTAALIMAADRLSLQRPAAADSAAGRLRRRAAAQSARRIQRDDRRRHAVRCRRDGAGRTADLGSRPDPLATCRQEAPEAANGTGTRAPPAAVGGIDSA